MQNNTFCTNHRRLFTFSAEHWERVVVVHRPGVQTKPNSGSEKDTLSPAPSRVHHAARLSSGISKVSSSPFLFLLVCRSCLTAAETGAETNLIDCALFKIGKWERKEVLSEGPPLWWFLQTLPLLLLWRDGFSESFGAGGRPPSGVETWTRNRWRLWLLSVPRFVAIKVQMSHVRGLIPVLRPGVPTLATADSPLCCPSGRRVDGLLSNCFVVVTWCLPLPSQAQRTMETSVPLHTHVWVVAGRSPVPSLQSNYDRV